jgi:hypothetical protein
MYRGLRPADQRAVRRSFYQWLRDPLLPTLHFSHKNASNPNVAGIWAVDTSGEGRACCKITPRGVYEWGWVGDHGAYDDLLSRIKKGGGVASF